jgi:hypothetical protein
MMGKKKMRIMMERWRRKREEERMSGKEQWQRNGVLLFSVGIQARG